MISHLLDKIVYFLHGGSGLLIRKIKQSKANSVCIYGAGVIGLEVVTKLETLNHICIKAIVDRKAEFEKCSICDFSVNQPNLIKQLSEDTLIVIASEAFVEDMAENARSLHDSPNVQIIHL